MRTSDPWRLDGRRILVTGGSKGIGAATVAELVGRGADVLAVARGADGLGDLAARTGCRTVAADVLDTDAIVSAVRTQLGGLDGLVNNAGVNRRKPLADTTDADLEALLDTNLRGAFRLCRALHPELAASRGAVVNVSSVASDRAVRTSTATYALTKGGLDALTRFLAATWGADGIRVNAVSPWYVATPLAAPVLADPVAAGRILDRTPLGRVGDPEDVARAIAFLLMPASAWITGVDLAVDGGFSVLGV